MKTISIFNRNQLATLDKQQEGQPWVHDKARVKLPKTMFRDESELLEYVRENRILIQSHSKTVGGWWTYQMVNEGLANTRDFTALICPPQDAALRAENAAMRIKLGDLEAELVQVKLENSRLKADAIRRNSDDLTAGIREQHASMASTVKPVGRLTSWLRIWKGEEVSAGEETR